MMHRDCFKKFVNQIRDNGNYRVFKNLKRNLVLPYATDEFGRKITIWCSNDYLGLSKHPSIIDNACKVLSEYGVGSGGTRNIAGNHHEIVKLEKKVANLQKKDSALIFNSGYVANRGTLTAVGKIFPDIVFISDELNHASIIDGIVSSKANRVIFKHNSIDDLKSNIVNIDLSRPKMIVVEGLYSMDGDFSPLVDIVMIAKQYNAMIYIDEVHSNGIYGKHGGGLAEHLGLQQEIDIIQGNFGKAFGSFGGYIAADEYIIDAIRLVAKDFIFTTSLPPSIVSTNSLAIDMVSNDVDGLRGKLLKNTHLLKQQLMECDIKFVDNDSHIIIIMINDVFKVRAICDDLFDKYGIYLQGINFPTVPFGSERLRITVSSQHNAEDTAFFCESLKHCL